MGFESAHAARRRLAVMAMSDERVHDALAQATFPGFGLVDGQQENEGLSQLKSGIDVVHHLDQLAQDIVSTPGAGGALLVAFAAQARALSLVLEATIRTQGAANLPAEVMQAVQNALRVPPPTLGFDFA